MFCGEPPNTASMCGTLPGLTSVTVTSQRANMSRMQVTVAAQFAALVFQAGTCFVELMLDDLLVRESSLPGVSVMPVRFR